MAVALAAAGARVLVHYRRAAQEAENVVAAIEAKGAVLTPSRRTWRSRTGRPRLAGQVRAAAGDRLAAEKLWSPHYIQHSAHIEPGRDGLFNLIRSLPPTLRYEAGLIVAEGEFVIVHGRFSGFGSAANWIAADILRVQDGILVEHWDVIQDEATEEQSKSKAPMFGDRFPAWLS